MPLSQVFRIFAVALIVLGSMSIDWAGVGGVRAQVSGGPTGWCTDYSGRNFRCGEGGGGGGGDVAAGCATAGPMTESQINRENAASFVFVGDKEFDAGNYEAAASHYGSALWHFPGHPDAHEYLGVALNELGVQAYKAGNYDAAYLYFERALDNWTRDEAFSHNLSATAERSSIPYGRSCAVCGRALISDVDYGVGASARLWNYAKQAIANYDNCLARLGDSCTGTAGKDFRAVAWGCNQTFVGSDDGLKACLRRAVDDAR